MGTVVFFNHPGGEHWGPGQNGQYPWNRRKHRRKYLVADGKVAERATSSWRSSRRMDRLAVWTEYEPDTQHHYFATDANPGMPWSWHEIVDVPVAPRGARNTEPWIFGKAFRYFLCRQDKIGYLRGLEQGDLILFGSWLQQGRDGRRIDRFNFFLDTVFVVEDSIEWPARADEPSIPKRFLDPPFVHASFGRCSPTKRRRFYWGKMLGDEPSREPFCWSPKQN